MPRAHPITGIAGLTSKTYFNQPPVEWGRADASVATIAVGTATGDNGTGSGTNGTGSLKGSAIRHSVAKTKSGVTAASEVYSETMNFRTSYSGQEADSPAIKEASGDANRAA